jgi:hypothetical protein
MTRPWKELGRYGGVGIELVLAILILAGAGHWLDERYWGARGWGMAAGFLLGVAAGVRNLMRVAARMQKDIELLEARDPQAGRWTVEENWLHPAAPAEGAKPDDSGDPHPRGPKSDDVAS